jgi:Zn-dependent peptidase ImmA (M78 family)
MPVLDESIKSMTVTDVDDVDKYLTEMMKASDFKLKGGIYATDSIRILQKGGYYNHNKVPCLYVNLTNKAPNKKQFAIA